ncbi:hypothetical protein S1OALGB6SA_1046 [Olavius algarvensis spirochete endosymbiont]|nr:hypothetical protein S1OALGB6SA_1046 [Olavius algarvensis spirochete endosymbiont]
MARLRTSRNRTSESWETQKDFIENTPLGTMPHTFESPQISMWQIIATTVSGR